MRFTLITEKGEEIIENAELIYIFNKLDMMDINKQPAFILESDNSYVQTRGYKNKLSVEFREYFEGKFKHVVLGSKEMSSINVMFESPLIGQFSVKKSELFTNKEVKELVSHYADTGSILGTYNKRNITRLFK